MEETQRILVLTLSFGSGHVQAARTIAHEVIRQEPHAQVRIIDALAGCRLLFRAAYVWPYWAMVRYAPGLWDRFFARRVALRSQQTAPEWAFQWGCSHVFKAIDDFKPHAIVATEVAACEIAAMAKREGLTAARIINVITDYEAEPVWVKPEVAAYAVADKHVRDQLYEWGAPQENIVTCGIPTDIAFSQWHDEKETREHYGITDDAPIVLLMVGGWGPTHMNEVVARLCKCSEPMHVIAATGHDTHVRRRLARLRPLPTVSLHVLGWTKDIAALMRIATVLVTKPGGLTVAEAAICALPIVIFDAIPGPEQRNAERLTEAGAAVKTTNPSETVASLHALLRDEDACERMSAHIRQLARPDAAATIARLTLEGPVPAELSERRMTA